MMARLKELASENAAATLREEKGCRQFMVLTPRDRPDLLVLIEVYADESRSRVLARFHFLRQQHEKTDAAPNWSLADFVAPRDSQVRDYIGAFAVCASGFEDRVAAFEAAHDDYSAILLKVLAAD